MDPRLQAGCWMHERTVCCGSSRFVKQASQVHRQYGLFTCNTCRTSWVPMINCWTAWLYSSTTKKKKKNHDQKLNFPRENKILSFAEAANLTQKASFPGGRGAREERANPSIRPFNLVPKHLTARLRCSIRIVFLLRFTHCTKGVGGCG